MRPLCSCGLRPAAINYYKDNKTYYRKLCEVCLKGGTSSRTPRWKTLPRNSAPETKIHRNTISKSISGADSLKISERACAPGEKNDTKVPMRIPH